MCHLEGVSFVVHQEDSKEWILMEKLVAKLTFTEGCVNSTELLFACCSLRNVGRVKLGKDSGM